MEEEESVNVGQRVEGLFNDGWFPGTVTIVADGVGENSGCTMIKIEYDDGDIEVTSFPSSRIRFI